MNGNFERDNGAYPYGTVSNGGGAVKVVFIPHLTHLHKQVIPNIIGTRVALALNAIYHTKPHNKVAMASAVDKVAELIEAEARKALDQGLIDGVSFSQLTQGL